MEKQVFLGGSCDPTTWRNDIAIPMLIAADAGFFNPQMADWDAADAAYKAQGYANGMTEFEAEQKLNSAALVFIIDGSTRAIASMLEAVEFAAKGRQVFVSVENIPDGTVVGGQTITGRELKDLNRARGYFLDSLRRCPSAEVSPNISKTIEAAVAYIKSLG